MVHYNGKLELLREAAQRKYYLDREIVPISSDTPTIEAVREHLDSEYWYIFLPPYVLI